MEEMTRQNKITVSLIAIALILITILGITYAYFLTRIEGNTNDNSVSITTADLALKYFDGNGYVRFTDVMPGTTVEKTFTVKNTGDSTVDNYVVVLEDLINTLNRTEDLTYTLTCIQKNKSGNIEDSCNGKTGEFPKLNDILITNSIKEGYTHEYSLKVSYANLDNVDQSVDMGSNIEAKVQIYNLRDVVNITGTITNASDGDYVQIESEPKVSQIKDGIYNLIGVEIDEHTLKVMNKDDEVIASKTIKIEKGPSANVTEDLITVTDEKTMINIDIDTSNNNFGLSQTVKEYNPFFEGTLAYSIYANKAIVEDYDSDGNSLGNKINKNIKMLKSQITGVADDAEDSGIFTSNDNDGASYLYRGTVRNNYVDFAGFTWRIVRINGDGSIRLILDGTLDNVCNGINSIVCTTDKFNDSNFDNAHIGYMYGLDSVTTDETRCLKLNENEEVIDLINEFSTKEMCESNNGVWTTTAYDATHVNIKSSTVKKKVDTFYKTFIDENYNAYLSDSLFCGTKTIRDDNFGVGVYESYYGPYDKLFRNKTVAYPTLKCEENYSKYNTKNNLTYPIALLSADELIMSGALRVRTNKKYYLFNSLNSFWWTMSPGYFSGSIALNLGSDTSGSSFGLSSVNGQGGVRPVINLRSDILLDGGDGTEGNMYKVKLPN